VRKKAHGGGQGAGQVGAGKGTRRFLRGRAVERSSQLGSNSRLPLVHAVPLKSRQAVDNTPLACTSNPFLVNPAWNNDGRGQGGGIRSAASTQSCGDLPSAPSTDSTSAPLAWKRTLQLSSPPTKTCTGLQPLCIRLQPLH